VCYIGRARHPGGHPLPDVSRQLQDALAGRYRIERELGRGGMATVYLADDLKHHRRVAIKVLDPEVAAAIGSERFLREIETVAKLSHPHVLTLHDSGQAAGLLFYVMPYVTGESLRQRLERDRQLPLEDALQITREVADALGFAHRQGVVHRDVKPENILLEQGHALVADFGIARAVAAAGAVKLTATGVVVGTPAYMSPEQAGGDSRLDGRSDQYSLGCVSYEMLAGQPPFTGPTVESLVHQHLSVAPHPVTVLRPTVTQAMAGAIGKALAKSPADRHADVGAFARALEEGARTPDRVTPRWRGGLALAATGAVLALVALAAWQQWWPFGGSAAPPAKKDWILVAEFDGPPADSTLAMAARSLLSAALDQSRVLATVPQDQIQQALLAAGRPPNTRVGPQLAKELAYRSAVRAVLEGTIGQIGRGYSIVLQVVAADTSRVLVTETATARDDGALIPVLGQLAKRLRARLGERSAELSATRPMTLVATPSLEAYRLYAQADRCMQGHRHRDALALLRRALEIDPEFSMAWAGLADCHTDWGQWDSVRVFCDQALRHPQRLTSRQRLEIEAERAAAAGEDSSAVARYQQLLAEDPSDLAALVGSADALSFLGRYDDSLERIRRAMRLSPFGPSEVMRTFEIYALWGLGRFADAREVTRSMPFSGTFFRAENELCAEEYAAAESISVTLLKDPAVMEEAPFGVHSFIAVARAARGAVREAAASYEQAGVAARACGLPDWDRGLRLGRLQLSELCGCPLPAAADGGAGDTTVAGLLAHGLGAAAQGEARVARACLDAAREQLRRRGHSGAAAPILLAAELEALAGHRDVAVRMLAPIAGPLLERGSRDFTVDPRWVRWELAKDWAAIGQPDSAIVQLERVVSPAVTGPTPIRPYARQRLVMLYARVGRLADARALLAVLEKSWDRPDPEVRRMLDEARSAVSSARAIAGQGAQGR
jgi:tRNA A-37 threonylcarbamoyl transferase component Bud32/tetratricopeptide (TPR) repeat protein